jgi:hypothetical protein
MMGNLEILAASARGAEAGANSGKAAQ